MHKPVCTSLSQSELPDTGLGPTMPGIPEGILPPKSAAKSGTEPPAGIQGAGTIDQPYDQGNQPEQAAGPGIEPPAGQTGKGTPDQPYDQGNQPGAFNPLPGCDKLVLTRAENTPTIAEPAESAAGPSSSTTESQEPEHPQRGRSASKIDNSKLTAHRKSS